MLIAAQLGSRVSVISISIQ